MSKSNKPAQVPTPTAAPTPSDAPAQDTQNTEGQQQGAEGASEGDTVAEGNLTTTTNEGGDQQQDGAGDAPEPTAAPTPTPEPTPEPTQAPEAPAATQAPAPLPNLAYETFEAKMVAEHASASQQTQALITYLNMYVSEMHPKRAENPKIINQQQVSLWNAIYVALETEADFDRNLTILLEYFREHGEKNGVFHAYNIYRGMEYVSLNSDVRVAFEYITTLLNMMARVEDYTKAQINVSMAVSEKVFSEGARSRVFGFFRLG